MDNLCEYNEEQLKKALAHAVNDILQKNIFPVPKPTVFLLGGQSGAGKSTIHQILLSQSPNFIVIDGDRYRAYHPNFAEIQEKYGENAANYTQKFVNSIINSLMKKFSNERYNLIIEVNYDLFGKYTIETCAENSSNSSASAAGNVYYRSNANSYSKGASSIAAHSAHCLI